MNARELRINYKWVENDPRYVKGIVYAQLTSGAVLCTIRPMMTWPWSKHPKEYMVKLGLTHVGTSRPIGGFYNTLEEAKKNADRMIGHVFGDDEVVEVPERK